MREAEYNQELGKQSIVRKMYDSGMSIEQIHEITEISEKELEELLG